MARRRQARRGMGLGAVLAVIAALCVVSVSPAMAAPLSVTRVDDPSPNGCQPNDCSLREAIIDANAAGGEDTIALGATTYGLALAGSMEDAAATGDLDITDDLVITGLGSSLTIIDGNDVDRVFDVLFGATVEMRDLGIVDGLAKGTFLFTGGGASGGGILNVGTLTLVDVVVQGNEAGTGGISFPGFTTGRGGSGGGILNAGTLTLDNVLVRGNVAGPGLDLPNTASGQGGPGGHGGGLYNVGTAVVTDSVIDLNMAGAGGYGKHSEDTGGGCTLSNAGPGGDGGWGGGVYQAGAGTLSLEHTLVEDNDAGRGGDGGHGAKDPIEACGTPGADAGDGGDGGGLAVDGATVALDGSTVRSNEAGRGGDGGGGMGDQSGVNGDGGTGGDGGGLFSAGGSVVLDSSTVSGNAAGSPGVKFGGSPQPAGSGSGIFLTAAGSVSMVNATVSGNQLPADRPGIHSEGTLTSSFSTISSNGPGVEFVGFTTMMASILDDAWVISAPNFTSGGYNRWSATGALPGATSTDLGPVDPLLGPLQANSAPDTHALGEGSPAIDVVPPGDCGVAADARGVARPQGEACDTGAYELESPPTVGLVDTSQGMWHLRNSAGLVTTFGYGNPGDLPVSGDWDGNGTSTPGLYRQSDGFFYSRNSNTTGIADAECFAGNPEDVPIAGDWDGDGDDNLGIYRPSQQIFYLFTTTCTGSPMGAAQISFLFGNPGDKPVAGDWDGDGIDEVGLHRESTGFFYWRNSLDTGIASGEIFFGDPGDRFVAGDWGVVDGVDTPAVFRPSDTTFYFRHTLTQGVADSQFVYGESPWLPVSGAFGLG